MSAAVILVAFAYLGLLFAVARYYERRNSPILDHPLVLSLGMAVYCTSWTFYGSVGQASRSGMQYMAVFIGPALLMVLAPWLLRRIASLAQAQHIASLADLLALRFGRSGLVGAVVALISLVGIVPYIGLQLKAVSDAGIYLANAEFPRLFQSDHALVALGITMAMAVFVAPLAGRRVGGRSDGLLAAIAVEAIVKLAAFLALGLWVATSIDYQPINPTSHRVANAFTFGIQELLDFLAMVMLSMLAFLCLPRQFHMLVIENRAPARIGTAACGFSAYLWLINLFVVPIALATMNILPYGTEDDMYVLALPMIFGEWGLALFVFAGGLAAGTGMIIVESLALSMMVANNLVLPALTVTGLFGRDGRAIDGVLRFVRQASVLLVLGLSYLYCLAVDEILPLASIGLIAFVAVAQVAPALIGGVFWSGATKTGAVLAMSVGTVLWAYTLFLPPLGIMGWLPRAWVNEGLFGWAWLKPYALFGLEGWSAGTHGFVWSLSGNLLAFIAGSLLSRFSPAERYQEALLGQVAGDTAAATPTVEDVLGMLERYLGAASVAEVVAEYERRQGRKCRPGDPATGDLVVLAEGLLSGAIGIVAARVVTGVLVKGEASNWNDLLDIADENSLRIAHSQQIEAKSRELEAALTELQHTQRDLIEAEKMAALGQLVAGVAHEINTPIGVALTAATHLAERTEAVGRQLDGNVLGKTDFLAYMAAAREATALVAANIDRAAHLVRSFKQVAADESSEQRRTFALTAYLEDVVASLQPRLKRTRHRIVIERGCSQEVMLDTFPGPLAQIITNLVMNSVIHAYGPDEAGIIKIACGGGGEGKVVIRQSDDGRGIAPEHLDHIFEPFFTTRRGEGGTGLGLHIVYQLVRDRLGGTIHCTSQPGQGTMFVIAMPRVAPGAPSAEATATVLQGGVP